MKFQIEKNIILEALSNVSRALSQKITIPVLSGIKFELTKKNLILTASDSELTIKVVIPETDIKNVDSIGDCIIQSKYITEIIRKMPSNIVCFESNEHKVKIFSDTNEYNLNCFDLKDYPNFNIQFSKECLQVSSLDFKNAIAQTSYSMSTQELRPLLTGTNLILNGNKLCLITTDSYRLAKKVINITSSIKDDVNIVIPGRTINELTKILHDDDKLLDIYIFSNKIVISYDNITIQSNLLSGSFPETSHFIPDNFAYMINLDLNVFYAAIDRASLLSLSKEKSFIKFNITAKEMLITSINEEVGRTEERISIESNKIDNLLISMNSKYLLDALKVFKDDNIMFLLNSESQPVVIKEVGDENLTALILPIQNY